MHNWSKTTIRDVPLSLRLYSTFGGIWGYSFRMISRSASSWYYVKKKYKLKVNFSYNILFLSSQFFHLIQFLLILILVFIW